ncbi:hypothetical protein HF1_06500 [Mycoplasma haemofelis str. Langford 1]|uniref:Uncharacterized protein n=2 Tax=Mycoplasma haemofelis TaxID=29501 RepID=F6FIE5_MYCHI|nr:hypothetical protein [Mycoplasma haemofelis]AEG72993.1 hypothetical protein MHF_0723 [Mycoplasma haemofelis Ohio2]CBY92658.1 hypothetical protein HF1_06500 [Mycoplasma haemofelis str. Langford 1]
MASHISKIALLTVGASGIGVGGYGVYHFSALGDTIGDKLKAKYKNSNIVFLNPEHKEWSNLIGWYSKVKNKPKKSNDATLALDEVKSWCTSSLNHQFKSEDDDLYRQVEELCWLNVNTLLEESGKESLRSSQNADHNDWKVVWKSYQQDSQKESKGIKIDDSVLNGTDEVAGGKAMHKWCNESFSKKMYSDKTLLPAFKAWCVN